MHLWCISPEDIDLIQKKKGKTEKQKKKGTPGMDLHKLQLRHYSKLPKQVVDPGAHGIQKICMIQEEKKTNNSMKKKKGKEIPKHP